jgi:hypothetical protein
MFMTALTTEHFVLQTAASTTVTEASSRASLYLMTVSSSLVAIGFTSGTSAFTPLISTVIPLVVVLGIFTIVRLVDTGVENVVMQTSIGRIRAYYATLAPDAATFFAQSDDMGRESAAMLTRRTEPVPARPRRAWMGLKAFFTMASMIAVLNSVVAGAGITLGCLRATSGVISFGCGAIVALGLLVAFYWYQNGRYQQSPL